METDFRMTMRHSGTETHVTVEGELDVVTAPKVREAVELAADTRPQILWLDAHKVRLLSSSGLEPLLEAARVCRSRDIAIKIRLSPQGRRVVEALGCTALLDAEVSSTSKATPLSTDAWFATEL